MILKAAKSHSSGHVGIICQQDLGSASALVLWRPGLGQLQSQREKAESVLGHQVMQIETAGRVCPAYSKQCICKIAKLPTQGWKAFESGPSQEVHDLPVPLLEDKFKTPIRVAACGANSPWAWKLVFRKGLLCLCHHPELPLPGQDGASSIVGALDK